MYSSSSTTSKSTGRYEYGEWIPVKHCQCGKELKLLTTWKPENCGRRFWKCVGNEWSEGCGLMDWFDPPMCKRSKKIIPGLLRKLNGYENHIHTLEMNLEAAEKPENKKDKMEKIEHKRYSCSRLGVCIITFFVVFASMYAHRK
ncbi:unnamed protein product [Cuscuta europaea]|uniref:GRF-type domain-containing protein n=1 Tax=Cuscuta europaea TaxID=41803 RepID=A0A9P1E0N4_CUSEU|nr:unnamed protein product [Cuscuta europaea]